MSLEKERRNRRDRQTDRQTNKRTEYPRSGRAPPRACHETRVSPARRGRSVLFVCTVCTSLSLALSRPLELGNFHSCRKSIFFESMTKTREFRSVMIIGHFVSFAQRRHAIYLTSERHLKESNRIGFVSLATTLRTDAYRFPI